MTRLRSATGLAAAGVLTFALAACGGGSDYCSTLEDVDGNIDTAALSGSEMPDADALTEFQSAFNEVAEVAPDDVKQSWQNVSDLFQVMIDADGDMTAIDPSAMEDFATINEDIEAIGTSAQEECDLEIGL